MCVAIAVMHAMVRPPVGSQPPVEQHLAPGRCDRQALRRLLAVVTASHHTARPSKAMLRQVSDFFARASQQS